MRPLLLLIALLLGLSGCAFLERRHALAALPASVGAVSVIWGNVEVYGFGPGGNETGFHVIRLSDAGARSVAEGGVAWLNAQEGGRLFPDWAETPVPQDDYWLGREGGALPPHPAPSVMAVLDRYGFGFALRPDHQAAADAALTAPGNFYAFGRGGLVALVVPATQTAYVFFAG